MHALYPSEEFKVIQCASGPFNGRNICMQTEIINILNKLDLCVEQDIFCLGDDHSHFSIWAVQKCICLSFKVINMSSSCSMYRHIWASGYPGSKSSSNSLHTLGKRLPLLWFLFKCSSWCIRRWLWHLGRESWRWPPIFCWRGHHPQVCIHWVASTCPF